VHEVRLRGLPPVRRSDGRGRSGLNQCPPGGDAVIAELAAALRREPKPLNPENGVFRPPQVAVIDEATCIGCTKCIQACPVDAIVGARSSCTR
jgi:electron transport complex protein RnfB